MPNIFTKLKQKLTNKIEKFKADSIDAYIEYQVMCSQPTTKETHNDNWTKLYKAHDTTFTCCCDAPIAFPNENEKIHCPKCNRQIMALIHEVR